MSDNTGFFTCKRTCWIVGGLFGFALWLMISGIIGFILGVIAAVAVALGLRKLFCSEIEAAAAETTPMMAASAASDTAPAAPAAAMDAATTAEVSPAAEDAAEVPAGTIPVEEVPVDATPALEEPDEVAEEVKPAAKAPAKKAVAKKAPAKKAAAKKAPAKTTSAKADAPAKATGKPKRPRTMKAPRKAGADDLKQLKGVGPKLEQTLNELGFWHFDQVAKWGADEIAWVDDNLKFKGRIERDGWVEQAKTLAEGGETEFSSKVKKGKVY